MVIVGDRKEIQRYAIESHARCLIVTGGFLPDKNILDLALKKRVSVISSPYDTATTVRLMHLSTPAREVYSSDFYSVSPYDMLLDVRSKMLESALRGCPVVDTDGSLQAF